MTTLPPDHTVAKTTAGSLGFNKHPIELSIAVADNLVFLYPTAGTDESGSEAPSTRQRPTFIVSITLTIPAEAPQPPSIESLKVQLTGSESLGFPNGPFEQNVLTYATKAVEDTCFTRLVPGNAYRWEVPVEVNNDATPYERMRFGRVFQKMKVKLVWGNQSWKNKYKNLEVERDVWMTCIPRVSNVLDYARTHRTFIDQLGPLAIHVRTQHLTVGGYLRIGLSLPSPSPTCKLIRMEVAILQSTTLHSRKRRGHIENCPIEKIKFHTAEGNDLLEILQGTRQNQVMRIPSCDRIRPSTLNGSKDASIRLSHQLEIRLVFQDDVDSPGGKPLVYTAKWPLVLPSCSCRWKSLKLPSYSEYDPSPVPDGVGEVGPVDLKGIGHRGRLRSHLDQTDCSCGIPLQKILGYEDEFDIAQRVCSSVLMREELMAAVGSEEDWSRQPNTTGNNSNHHPYADIDGDEMEGNVGVGEFEGRDSVDDETIQRQKAMQQYNRRVQV